MRGLNLESVYIYRRELFSRHDEAEALGLVVQFHDSLAHSYKISKSSSHLYAFRNAISNAFSFSLLGGL